MVIECDGES